MTAASDHRRSTPWPAIITAGLIIAYVLSYAPVYRIKKSCGSVAIHEPMAIYLPLDWLIDNSPLEEPLFRWADLWGVRGDFVWAAAARRFANGGMSHIVDPEAETPHLYEHVIDLDEATE